jgi:hypothetical protein
MPFRRLKATHLITALDIILILAVAATIVMALGARGRFPLGPVMISIRDPLRPLLLAVVTCVIRLIIGRGQPLLPSLHRSSIQSRLEAELECIRRPAPATPEVKYYALAAALASLVWLTPQLVNIRHVPDPGDPVFSAWRLARFAHQLMNEPTRLFDGNIYHPSRDTLTYSDATVLEAVAAFPFLAAGADPLVVSNALLLASFPLCALAFFFTAWRLTADPQAACVAGILGGLSVFKIEHYSHLELQFFFFAPLAILYLLRMLAAPSWRTGALFGAIVAAQWLACMYFGVMLLVFLAPTALLAAVAWQLRLTRGLAAAVVTSAAVTVALGSVSAVPFVRNQAERGHRSIQEVRSFSATPASYGDRHRFLATYRNIGDRSQNLPERELFPGLLPIALGAIGLAPPVSLGTLALAAGTAVAFDGSLGTNGLIYDELYNYVHPFRGMRVPARFGALVGTGLFLLSAYGAQRVLRLGRTPRRRAVILVSLAAGALIELRSAVPLEPYPDSIPAIYSAVTGDMVLAELPMEDNTFPSFSYMYFSTFHWARIINGQSGHFPAGHTTLVDEMESFPTEYLLRQLRERGATHITVNCALYSRPWHCRSVLERMDALPQFELISSAKWEGAEVRLYEIR